MIFLAVNCTEPPEKPESGTWEWDGGIEFENSIEYTCGPYGNFENLDGTLSEKIVSTCEWNKTWTPSALPPCVATSCQVIPIAPPETGMLYLPDPENPMTITSDYAIYNPRLPYTMNFPGPQTCADKGDILMIVGSTPRVILIYNIFNYYATFFL